ncbi:MAG: sirohydrochlorin chelatase [Thermogutta sp.]
MRQEPAQPFYAEESMGKGNPLPDAGREWPFGETLQDGETAQDPVRPDLKAVVPCGRELGVLLVGHGTREPSGIEQTLVLSRLVEARLRGRGFRGEFALAFLELAQPDIAAALSAMRPRRLRRLIVAPLMLFAAGHVRRDIPQQVEAEFTAGASPDVRYLDAFNDDPAVLRLSLRREQETGTPPGHEDSEDATYYLFVARGNRDPEALAMTRRVLEVRARLSGRRHHGPAYLALAAPSLDEALDQAAQGPWRRVIVQPHLLFRGLLEHELRHKVARRAAARADIAWVVTDVLGPDPTLAESLADRILAAV